MAKKLVIIALIIVMLGPTAMLVSIGVLLNPASNAACTTNDGATLQIGDVPDSLQVTTTNRETFTLTKAQLTHAATIITVGHHTAGVTNDGIIIALMAALTESGLRMLTNTTAYPDSARYPNDGNGSDHDSLGLFQMRPQTGWGTIAQLMNPTYQARAFYGGPTGPNHGSPRGLLDIPGWATLPKGAAAQAVEVSAYPHRYATFEPAARTIMNTLTNHTPPAASGRVVFPLPEGTWIATSPFGMRVHPITGVTRLHAGADYSAPAGTPILAAADGHVTKAGPAGGYGNLIVIEHRLNGAVVATAYAHMWHNGIHVKPGDHVTAGQHIADIGSSGMSTGPHLHFEVRPGGTHNTSIDPAPWLATHHATNLTTPATTRLRTCDPAEPETIPGPGGTPAPLPGNDPHRLVNDPTSNGRITARLAHLMTQTRAAFPTTRWSCYSPRPGQKSEHPLGRACDVTFGNQIGTRPTPPQLETGWQTTNWLKQHAETLGIQYLIWQGKIWSTARNAEGWRPYNGGGMHNPTDITGGHYDHLHITVK